MKKNSEGFRVLILDTIQGIIIIIIIMCAI